MTNVDIWNDFSSCECLKSILINTGYDNIPSLMCMNDDQLTNLENYVEENPWIIEKINCDHIKSYGTLTKFKFLPGHRAFLLDWCQNKSTCQDSANNANTFKIDDAAFSPVLREIISSALSNHQKAPNSHRFSRLVMDFSIY